MHLRETARSGSERMKGRSAPAADDVRAALTAASPDMFRFNDDGSIPNNPRLPMLLYPRTLLLDGFADPAAAFEVLFEANGWSDCWRDGIYDYVHYHSRIHEVLGIARGRARVRFGGDAGTAIDLAAGDVAVLPAGTGHQCLVASAGFLVVGAYPADGTYDECRGTAAEHARALRTIPKVALPDRDPVFGREGPLSRLWARR